MKRKITILLLILSLCALALVGCAEDSSDKNKLPAEDDTKQEQTDKGDAEKSEEEEAPAKEEDKVSKEDKASKEENTSKNEASKDEEKNTFKPESNNTPKPPEASSNTNVPQKPPAQEQKPAEEPKHRDDYAAQVLTLVNQERAKEGLGPLTMNYTLVNGANVRSQELVTAFSHTRPNGTSCITAITEAGLSYMAAGENIAAGQSTPQGVMASWMGSAGHRANILSADFSQIAISCYYVPDSTYKYYWVQLFIG